MDMAEMVGAVLTVVEVPHSKLADAVSLSG